MKLTQLLEDIFSALNNAGIRYCMMRDYDSIDSILRSEDIDIVIHKDDTYKAKELFKQHEWKTPKHNFNYYGHQQFFKWDGEMVIKLDVLFGFYFKNGLYTISDQDTIFNRTCFLDVIKIPEVNDGVLIHLCHIVLDKQSLSKKNYSFLRFLLNDSKCNMFELAELSKELIDSEYSIFYLRIYNVLKEKYIHKNDPLRMKFRWLCVRLHAHWHKRNNIRIAIIGVDGSGKSTSVNALKSHYGSNVTTQYMGFGQYETKLAKSVTCLPHIPVFGFLISCIVLPIEMLFRYHKAVKKHKEIIVFDRYPWEAYDNNPNSYLKWITYIAFKLPFPRPDGFVYLHCPVEVSLSRKDDITDIVVFRQMKKNFDSKYKNYKGGLSIDTSIVDKVGVVKKTIEYANILKYTL